MGVEHFLILSLLFLGIVWELLLKSPGPLTLTSFQCILQIKGVGGSSWGFGVAEALLPLLELTEPGILFQEAVGSTEAVTPKLRCKCPCLSRQQNSYGY